MLIHIFTIYVCACIWRCICAEFRCCLFHVRSSNAGSSGVETDFRTRPGNDPPTRRKPDYTPHTLAYKFLFSEIVFVFLFFCISAFFDPPITIPLLSIYRRLHTSFLFSCVQMFWVKNSQTYYLAGPSWVFCSCKKYSWKPIFDVVVVGEQCYRSRNHPLWFI